LKPSRAGIDAYDHTSQPERWTPDVHFVKQAPRLGLGTIVGGI